MKTQLFLKTALVAGLLAISGASFATATTVTTTFTGTIPSSCSVAPGTAGVLVLSPNGSSVGTTNTGGVRGTFVLTCTGTANMTIALPIPAAGSIALTNNPNVSYGSILYAATAPDVAIANSGGPAATSKPSGTYQVEIGYGYGNTGTQMASGDYASSVVTTVTPN
jgi:hypothetical protein